MQTLNDPINHFPPPLMGLHVELQDLIRLLGWCGRLSLSQIPCAYRLLTHEGQSRRALDALRTAAALCSEACPSADCLVNLGAMARVIRDNYLKLLDLLPRFGPLSIFRGRMESSLYAWDDMVEDCTVGADREIRETLFEIAKRIR